MMKHIYKTKCPVDIRGYYGGSAFAYPDFQIPAGLLCTPSGMHGQFFLGQLPKDIFPEGSGLRHDAVHYGIFIDAENVEDVTPPPIDIPSAKEVSLAALAQGMVKAQKETVAPYASKREGFFWVFLNIRMNGNFIVVVRHEDDRTGTVVYEGPCATDAIAAWNGPYPERCTC